MGSGEWLMVNGKWGEEGQKSRGADAGGIIDLGNLLNTSPELFDRILAVNLRARGETPESAGWRRYCKQCG